MKYILMLILFISCSDYSYIGHVINSKKRIDVKTRETLAWLVDVEINNQKELIRDVEVPNLYQIGTKVKVICTGSIRLLCNGIKIKK